MLASRNTYTWIQKYIFPGGLLPSVEAIIGVTERHTRLRTVDMIVPASALRRDAAAVARTLRRATRCGVGVGFRRCLPPHVGAVPGLLRGRVPVRLPRRLPVDVRPDGGDERCAMNCRFLVVSVASIGVLVVVHGITFADRPTASAGTTSSTSRGVSVSSASPPSPRCSAPATSSAGSCCWSWWRCGGCGWPGTWSASRRARAKTPGIDALLRGDFSAGTSCCARSSSSRPLRAGSSRCRCRCRRYWDRRRRCCCRFWLQAWRFGCVGVFFEAVGDHQLRRFKADPANKGVVMDRGLWAWTRHPNYFGDACCLVGAVVGLHRRAGFRWLTVLSPVLMTYFLVYATGARLTEKHMKDRPGFREYCSRTSFFIPTTAQIANIVTIIGGGG